MAAAVVEFKKADGCQAVADKLRALADRAEAGEFCAAIFVLLNPSGGFLTGEAGVKINRLEQIGILESIKMDAYAAMASRPDDGAKG